MTILLAWESYLSSPADVLDQLPQVAPDVFFSVPAYCWALDVIGRRDGATLWPDRELANPSGDVIDVARRIAIDLAAALGVPAHLCAAYEDPFEILRAEAALPVDIDPRVAGLDDPEERKRLAALLYCRATNPVPLVMPLAAPD